MSQIIKKNVDGKAVDHLPLLLEDEFLIISRGEKHNYQLLVDYQIRVTY